MAKQSSQKFIARNRAPRVQIEYDVEVYGAQKKVELPFVMAVMADFSAKNVRGLVRMWTVVFFANMAGTLFALFCRPRKKAALK